MHSVDADVHDEENGGGRAVDIGVPDDGPRVNGPRADAGGADGTGSGTDSGMDGEVLALERELTVLLRRARASSAEMARAVHPDLEPAAYGLLVCLEETGRRRATDLAGYIGVGKATMSRQLRSLEGLGFVAREPDPDDGRASLLHLTDRGSERLRSVRDARRARYVERLADWDRTEVADLARLLHQLNSAAWSD
jgi:DNA-binding MarR family transcriptional regulator